MLLSQLYEELNAAPRWILAIDGNCCAGKSTFAAQLAERFSATVFHMDDFFLRPEQRTAERLAAPGGNVEYERFRAEVLLPLTRGADVRLRRFDCGARRLLDARIVPFHPRVIVEGSYSLHPALWELYDRRILLTVDPAVQRQRLLAREGASRAERFLSLWLPLEAAYFSSFDPKDRADLVLDTSDWSKTAPSGDGAPT